MVQIWIFANLELLIWVTVLDCVNPRQNFFIGGDNTEKPRENIESLVIEQLFLAVRILLLKLVYAAQHSITSAVAG
ncbi:hypothetical protein D3C87_1048300 [compost metagenome]